MCGPGTLVPEEFSTFLSSKTPYDLTDTIKERGKISISRSLEKSIKNADAVITLRLQKERMTENLLNSIKSYSDDFCLNPEKLSLNNKDIPILHPGPVNRGIEISSRVIDEYPTCLINEQVTNGIPVRMALLYLLSKHNQALKAV